MPALLVAAPDERPSAATVSVLILARDPISRAGVEGQLHSLPEISVQHPSVGRQPDVALIVADTVDDWVLFSIRTFRQHSLSPIVVVADADGPAETMALNAGARGMLPRSLAERDRLAWTIRKVYRGDPVFVRASQERPEPAPPLEPQGQVVARVAALNERDRQVLRLLADGCDTSEIARKLAYSEPTIKNVIQRLFEQLKARNRVHAVALALRSGLI